MSWFQIQYIQTQQQNRCYEICYLLVWTVVVESLLTPDMSSDGRKSQWLLIVSCHIGGLSDCWVVPWFRKSLTNILQLMHIIMSSGFRDTYQRVRSFGDVQWLPRLSANADGDVEEVCNGSGVAQWLRDIHCFHRSPVIVEIRVAIVAATIVQGWLQRL